MSGGGVAPTRRPVEFVVSVWQGNVDRLLAPGVIDAAARMQCYPFDARTVVVNNVDDPADVARRVAALVAAGEIDRVVWVRDEIDAALDRLGVRRRQFGRFWNWANVQLVMLTMTPPAGLDGRLLYLADPDSPLLDRVDWITPAQEILARRRELWSVGPAWQPEGHPNDSVWREADEADGRYAIVRGYWDGTVLLDPSPLLARDQPLRRVRWWRCPASLRYPSPQFRLHDAYLDAWMRTTGHTRAVDWTVRFQPVGTAGGLGRYDPHSLVERLGRKRKVLVLRALERRSLRDPRLRVDGLLHRDPAFRPPLRSA